MSKRSLGIIIFALFVTPILFSESKWHLAFDLNLDKTFGYTNYDLNAQGVMSRLEFPLDAYLIGINLGAELEQSAQRDWLFNVGLYINVSDPSNLMKDYDWWVEPDYPNILWSSTESNTLASILLLEAQADKHVFSLGLMDFFLSAGYRYHWISQNIKGYKGWQYYWNGSAYDLYLIKSTAQALTYKIAYHLPFVGVMISMEPLPGLSLDIAADYMLVLVSDSDDHVLRNKLSTAQGIGNGIHAAVELSYHIRVNNRVAPYLSFSTDFSAILADTQQTQYWYGDDSATAYDDTGNSISNIAHLITSQQFRFGLKMGLMIGL